MNETYYTRADRPNLKFTQVVVKKIVAKHYKAYFKLQISGETWMECEIAGEWSGKNGVIPKTEKFLKTTLSPAEIAFIKDEKKRK